MSLAWQEMQPQKPRDPPRRDSWDLAFERAARTAMAAAAHGKLRRPAIAPLQQRQRQRIVLASGGLVVLEVQSVE